MIREMWHDGWLGKLLAITLCSLPFLVVFMFVVTYYDVQVCHRRGGKMVSKANICVSQDGRILF